MKKQELLNLLNGKGVTASNLKTFCNKNKRLKIKYGITLDGHKSNYFVSLVELSIKEEL